MAGGHVVSLSNLTTLRDNNTACLSHSVCCQTSSSWCSLIPGHAEPSSISESVKATHIATGLRSGTSGVHNELSNLCVHASIVQTAVLEPCEVLRMRTASVCMTLKPVLRVLAVLKKKERKRPNVSLYWKVQFYIFLQEFQPNIPVSKVPANHPGLIFDRKSLQIEVKYSKPWSARM